MRGSYRMSKNHSSKLRKFAFSTTFRLKNLQMQKVPPEYFWFFEAEIELKWPTRSVCNHKKCFKMLSIWCHLLSKNKK